MHIFRDKVISAIIISSYLFRMAHSVSASISGGVTLFFFLSHALKNTANQIPGLPLHILRYATGGSPLYFTVIPCAQQFTGFHLRTSQPFNSCELLRTFPNTSGNRFRRLVNTSEDFPKIFQKFKKS